VTRGDVPGPSKRSPLAEAAKYSQIGVMLVAPMLALGGIGYWMDGRWGTAPWLLLAGLILGMAGGFVNVLKLVLPPRSDGPAPGGRGR
jgi:ATP synthase protein I